MEGNLLAGLLLLGLEISHEVNCYEEDDGLPGPVRVSQDTAPLGKVSGQDECCRVDDLTYRQVLVGIRLQFEH
jgi:hypothetical protein